MGRSVSFSPSPSLNFFVELFEHYYRLDHDTMIIIPSLSIVLALAAAVSSTNLTVSFDVSGEGSCGADSSTSLLTFTTSSVPPSYQCFNLNELFADAQSQRAGSRNETSPISSYPYEVIDWVVSNTEPFDSSRNYSQISYLQQNTTDPQEGKIGTLLFEVFNGQDCRSTASSSETIFPWFGWTCQSPANGSCSTVPYTVGSFQVGSAAALSSRKGKCWAAAFQGSAAGKSGSTMKTVATAFVTLGLVLWC